MARRAPSPPEGAAARGAPPPLVKKGLAEAGAILSGLLYFVAFAGFDQWYLTFVSLVPLYVSLHGQTTRRATWLGFLCGLAMNLGGFYWLLNMLKTFSGFPTPLCLVFVVIICAYQGSRLAFMGWLFGRAANRGWPVPVVFAGAFAVSELVFPLLFPWFYAATVHNVPVLLQLADIGGPILVGLVLVAVNMAIAEPLRARLAARQEASSKPAAKPREGASEERPALDLDKRVIGVGAIALLVALLYGVARISMVRSTMSGAESARVGYVQGNMGLMQKREKPGEGLRRHVTLTEDLRNKGVDLVVWSESSVTFAVQEDMGMKTSFYREKFAGRLGVPTIFGAVLFRVEPERERWFNTALSTDAKGNITGRYDKQFLLAFGEYLPFGDTFPIMYKWSPHSGRFSQGTSFEPVEMEIKGQKRRISILICYEDILPSFTNKMVAHADPELLVNITNDAWFGDTTEPWEHLALAKLRAIEHRRYLVRATNSGVSAIVDPLGGLVSNTKTFVTDAQEGEIRWMRGRTVYETVGDSLWWLATVAMLVVSFKRRTPQDPSEIPAKAA
ncbi:MAG: apolipoprotein N-acyltransferase [Deltaproteobacteria bacterium]|nr:apolipoprotein N-acyltransferase [Deltaproteobacteria bacterium]